MQQELQKGISRVARAKAKPRAKEVNHFDKYAYTQAEAKQFIPDCVGCTLQKDTRMHMRWKAEYVVNGAPEICTKVWNDERSDTEALKIVLRFLWDCHEQETGEPCPFGADWLHSSEDGL